MSIKERKEITKMLVKVEVAILMMIFTYCYTQCHLLEPQCLWSTVFLLAYMPKQNLKNTRKSSIKGSFFYFYPRLGKALF